MAFKLNDEDCFNALRGDVDKIYQKELMKLHLDLETEIEDIRYVQGQIYLLKQVIGLKDKAEAQKV